jgi:hypothetical protein
MGKVIAGNNEVCAAICEALGLKHCIGLNIDMQFGEIVTITAKYYPEIHGIKQLESIFKKFSLVERKED